MDRENDSPQWIAHRPALHALGFALFGALFVYAHLEFQRTFGYLYVPLRLPMLTLLWLAMCGLLLLMYMQSRNQLYQVLLVCFVLGLTVKLLLFDLPSWNVNDRLMYGGGYSLSEAMFRLFDFGMVLVFFAVAATRVLGRTEDRQMGTAFGLLGLAMLFGFATLELNTVLGYYVPGLRAGGISILWSLFAIGLLLTGIGQNRPGLRYLGLTLFTIVVWKVFFVDLATLDAFYRIVAFLVLGVLLLCGSFIYLKYRETFAVASAEDSGDDSGKVRGEPRDDI